MKIKEVLTLSSNELSLILEALVIESDDLKGGSIELEGKKFGVKRLAIERKIARITSELRLRGWEAVVYGREVKFEPLANSKEQRKII